MVSKRYLKRLSSKHALTEFWPNCHFDREKFVYYQKCITHLPWQELGVICYSFAIYETEGNLDLFGPCPQSIL